MTLYQETKQLLLNKHTPLSSAESTRAPQRIPASSLFAPQPQAAAAAAIALLLQHGSTKYRLELESRLDVWIRNEVPST